MVEKEPDEVTSASGPSARILVVDANAGYRSVISHVVAGRRARGKCWRFDAARRQLERPRKFDDIRMSADSRVSPKQPASAGCGHALSSCWTNPPEANFSKPTKRASQVMPSPLSGRRSGFKLGSPPRSAGAIAPRSSWKACV